MSAEKKLTFEEALSRLEKIVALMENPECAIETLMSLYKEAAGLSAFLNDALSAYEKEAAELFKTPQGFAEKPFGGDVEQLD